MPTFCRHNRFVQNCPICGEPEQAASAKAPRRRAPAAAKPAARGGVRIRQAARDADDGFRSALVPGIRLRADAERLAGELGFAAGRLGGLATAPAGCYAEVASEPDNEEALWLAFLIAYLGPLEDGDPFATIRAVRTTWASGALPELDGVACGPRTAHDPGRGAGTLEAYRAWAQRAGSQAASFAGEPHWTPKRRFERAFERLALPGLHRAARFDLLVTLGRLGRVELAAGSLHLVGTDATTTAAKRAFGIGDALLLDRRAANLADACGVPLEALDLALYNWSLPAEELRAALGAGEAAGDPEARDRSLAALLS